MKDPVYQKAIQHTLCAFAYHRAVFDENHQMIDYEFLDVNESFERMTGLKKKDIINKRFLRDIALDQEHSGKWIEIYRTVFETQETIELDEFSEEYRKHYLIKAFAVDREHFVTLFQNQTYEKKLQEIARYFIENVGEQIDYDRITRFAFEITGAELAAFNLFDAKKQFFTTVSIFGTSPEIQKGLDILRLPLAGQIWPFDPVRDAMIKGQEITFFDELSDLTGDVIPLETIRKLEALLPIGPAVVAKISKKDEVIGDFTLIFRKENRLRNRELFLLFLSQLGLFLEKTKLENDLFSSQNRFYTLAEFAPVGFISCTTDGTVTYANKRLLEIMGSPSTQGTMGINLLTFAPLRANGFATLLRKSMEQNTVEGSEMRYTSLWGKSSWLKVTITPVQEAQVVAGANIVIDDITEKKEKELDLKERAERDPLTHSFNRHALETSLPEKLREADRYNFICCFVILDVDDFKQINDTFGHRAGDRVLKYLARRVQQELRPEDLLIRTGGDEFLIYLHDIQGFKNAERFVKRVFEKISARYRMDDEDGSACLNLNVSCSIGTSFYPRDGKTEQVLMAKADEALYKVKKSGKANYHMEYDGQADANAGKGNQ